MVSIAESISKLGNKSSRVRRKAEKELVKIGEPAVEPLIKAFNNENWRARWRAADALGKIGKPQRKE